MNIFTHVTNRLLISEGYKRVFDPHHSVNAENTKIVQSFYPRLPLNRNAKNLLQSKKQTNDHIARK